uniref:hypothetical protein n=1 Tax=Corynebacterium glyciniphilum TaxID=1404244 RepID=UPI0011AB8D45
MVVKALWQSVRRGGERCDDVVEMGKGVGVEGERGERVVGVVVGEVVIEVAGGRERVGGDVVEGNGGRD